MKLCEADSPTERSTTKHRKSGKANRLMFPDAFVEDEPMVDYSEMEVPEDVSKIRPKLAVKGYDLPDFDLYGG